jgi:tetratricopeptide (TPR) repeat protein
MPVDNSLATKTETELRQRVANSSQDPDDYRDLADFLFPLGLYEEIIALYQRALSLPLSTPKKAQLLMELGWIHYDIGNKAQAAVLAREAHSLLSAEPKNSEVLYCQGASQALVAACSWLEDPQVGAETARLALESLEQSIANNSDFQDKPQAYIDAAQVLNMLGSADKAITYCETCIKLEIKEIQKISCLITYAQALQGVERFTEAEQAITEAFRYAKNYKSGLLPSLYMELGSIQRFTDRLTESRASYERALTALKSDPYLHGAIEPIGEINFDLATVCFDLEDYKSAIAAYAEVLHIYPPGIPSYWTSLYWQGRSYEIIEEYFKARDCYAGVQQSPVATEEDKALARDGLMWVNAKLDYGAGKYEEAAAAFENIASHYDRVDADYWSAIVWLGSSYEGLRAYEKARIYYEQVLGSSSASDANKVIAQKGLIRSLARLAYDSQDYKEAAAKVEELLGHHTETDPDHWDTMIWLGGCYQGLGDYTNEQDCYRKVLGSRHAADTDKVLARKKLTSSLGKAYYATKSYAEAIAAFEDVVASCSEDEPYRFHILVWLGYSYLASEQYESGKHCLQKVLASPDASEVDKASARNGMLNA